MIDTKHNIGDVVYTANQHGVDKDIIKAIKVIGINKAVSYGFTSKNYGGMLGALYGSDYTWRSLKEIFTTETTATKYYEKLNSEQEKKTVFEKQHKLALRKAELKEELKQIEAGIDPDDLEKDEDY